MYNEEVEMLKWAAWTGVKRSRRGREGCLAWETTVCVTMGGGRSLSVTLTFRPSHAHTRLRAHKGFAVSLPAIHLVRLSASSPFPLPIPFTTTINYQAAPPKIYIHGS
jgi:hypothetical protein